MINELKIMTEDEVTKEINNHFKGKEIHIIKNNIYPNLINVYILDMRFDGKEWLKIQANTAIDLISEICIGDIKKTLDDKINKYWSDSHE